MDDLNNLYNELIMEHSMNSYNKKKLQNPSCSKLGHNPNCGDEITVEIKVENGIITDMAFLRTWMRDFSSINLYNDRYIKR